MALSANLIAAIADKQHRPVIKLEIDWDGDGVFDDETGYVLDAAGIESFNPDTGALMAHGFIESIGLKHFKYDPSMNDKALFDAGYNRVYPQDAATVAVQKIVPSFVAEMLHATTASV